MGDVQLDGLDMQILSALQECNQTSAQDLADRVPLSPSAILRRIRQYRASGVIAADVSVLDPAVTGERLSIMLLIQLARQAPAAAEAFRATLGRSPHVQVVMDIAGAYDVMCITVFQTMEAFNAFADAHVADHPSVQRYEAIFVRRRIKFGAGIPLHA